MGKLEIIGVSQIHHYITTNACAPEILYSYSYIAGYGDSYIASYLHAMLYNYATSLKYIDLCILCMHRHHWTCMHGQFVTANYLPYSTKL